MTDFETDNRLVEGGASFKFNVIVARGEKCLGKGGLKLFLLKPI